MKKWKKYDTQRHSNIRDGDVVLKQETAGSSRKERVTTNFFLSSNFDILIFSKADFQKQCVNLTSHFKR